MTNNVGSLEFVIRAVFEDQGFDRAIKGLDNLKSHGSKALKILGDVSAAKRQGKAIDKIVDAGFSLKQINSDNKKTQQTIVATMLAKEKQQDIILGKAKKIKDIAEKELKVKRKIAAFDKAHVSAIKQLNSIKAKDFDNAQREGIKLNKLFNQARDPKNILKKSLGKAKEIEQEKELTKELEKAGVTREQLSSKNKKMNDVASSKLAKYRKQQKDTAHEGKTNIFGFQRAMGALSILFLSQSISQGISTMTTAVTASFMKITEGQTEAGKAVTTLAAHWEYLKFSIGNALATALIPMIPVIVNLIEVISNFAQKHPKLIAMATAFTFIAAMVSLAFAQIMLLGSGIKALTGASTLGKGLTLIGTKIKAIGTAALLAGTQIAEAFLILAFFSPWTALLTIVVAIAAVLSLWNLAQYPDEVDKVKDAFKDLGTSVVDNLKNIGQSFMNIFTKEDLSSEDWAKVTSTSIQLVTNSFQIMFDVVTLGITTLVDSLGFLGNLLASFGRGVKAMFDKDDGMSFADGFNEKFEGLDNFEATNDAFKKMNDDGTKLRKDLTDSWTDMADAKSNRKREELQLGFDRTNAKNAGITLEEYYVKLGRNADGTIINPEDMKITENTGVPTLIDSNGQIVESNQNLIDFSDAYNQKLLDVGITQEELVNIQNGVIDNNYLEVSSMDAKNDAHKKEIELLIEKAKAMKDTVTAGSSNSLSNSIAYGEVLRGRAKEQGMSLSDYVKST